MAECVKTVISVKTVNNGRNVIKLSLMPLRSPGRRLIASLWPSPRTQKKTHRREEERGAEQEEEGREEGRGAEQEDAVYRR